MTRTSKPGKIAAALMIAFVTTLSGQANAQSISSGSNHGHPANEARASDGERRATPDGLLTSVNSLAAALPTSQPIAQSQARKRDSVLNGLLIGAGVGALLGLIPDHYDDCEECHDSLYGSIAVGAGVGLLVDLIRRPKAPTSSGATDHRVGLHLAVSQGAVGVRGRIAWK